MKVKHIEVDANTHLMAKAQSAMRGMTMKDYILSLVEKDKKEIMKGK